MTDTKKDFTDAQAGFMRSIEKALPENLLTQLKEYLSPFELQIYIGVQTMLIEHSRQTSKGAHKIFREFLCKIISKNYEEDKPTRAAVENAPWRAKG